MSELFEKTISDQKKAPSGEPMRLEITGLRAIGIAGIVIGHYWVGIATGAFVFIDSFFAISGFLITGLLLLEYKRKGRISFPVFWMRRARRILPAAILVLLVCIPATIIWAPLGLWQQFLLEIRASGLYVENWFLAFNSVDYLNLSRQTSPVQHYWSLSIEEQFYIFWPFVIALACIGAKKFGFRGFLFVVLGAVTVLSFAYSVYLTDVDKAAAYFNTFSRVWEITAGGLLALIGTAKPGNDRLRGIISWAGLVIIFTAAFVFSPATPFPGPAALAPVIGVMMVLWAGMPKSRLGPGWLFGSRASRWLGDTSYSIYLWHWPLIVFAPFVLDRELNTPIKIGLVILLLLISAPTRRFVEDPVRLGTRFNKYPPRVVLSVSALMIGVVVFGCFLGFRLLDQKREQQVSFEAPRLDPRQPCFGAAARDPEKPCQNPRLRLQALPIPNVTESAEAAFSDPAKMKAWELRQCERRLPRVGAVELSCRIGLPPDKAKRNIALIGDSHSIHWRPAFAALAKKQGWSVITTGKLGCAWNFRYDASEAADRKACLDWQRSVPRWLRAHPEVDTVVLANGVLPYKPSRYKLQKRGYQETWRSIPSSVKHLVVIRETPRSKPDRKEKLNITNQIAPPGAELCIQKAVKDKRPPGPACAEPRSRVLDPYRDPAVAAIKAFGSRGSVIDLTDFFCGPKLCYPVVGGVWVYQDQSHLTPQFSRSLAPYLLRQWQGLPARSAG